MKNTATKLNQNPALKKDKENSDKGRFTKTRELRRLFLDELEDIYWIEKAIVKTLPRMIKNATGVKLVEILSFYLEKTKEHVLQMGAIFYAIGEKAKTKKSELMSGLIKDGGKLIESASKGIVRDAAIMSLSQKVEHYKMAMYGTLYTFAKTLQEDGAAILLLSSLKDEEQANEKLKDMANTSSDTDDAIPNKDIAIKAKDENPDVLHSYLVEAEKPQISMIRIIEVRGENIHNLNITAQSAHTIPLSINLDF